MSAYQAARKRVEKINASGAGYGQAVLDVYGHEPEGQFYTDLRALLAGPPEPSVEEVAVSFEVWQDDDLISLSEGPLEAAWHEACHYAATYGQTGPVAVYKVTRALIIAALPPAPKPDE
jgi:hypothetical protein